MSGAPFSLISSNTNTMDFFVETSLGNLPGFSVVIVNGFNPLSNINIEEDVWDIGGILTFPSSAQTLDVVSDDANDTSAGTGARTVLVRGLDSSYIEISETVIMNGTTAVTTTNSYLRIFDLRVLTWGSSKINEGEITGSHTTSGDDLSRISIGFNISKNCQFTIPAGQTGLLLNVTLGSDSPQPKARVKVKTRIFGQDGFITNAIFEGSQMPFAVNLDVFSAILEKTDITFAATAVVNNAFTVSYSLLLVDNP